MNLGTHIGNVEGTARHERVIVIAHPDEHLAVLLVSSEERVTAAGLDRKALDVLINMLLAARNSI